jgi:formiminotetrahydrofolate cyclodeaminase
VADQPPLRERTIGDYLDRLGSSHPDPGGGSVAGLVGALGAALGQMVISLTRGNDPLASLRSSLQETVDSMLASSADDERAYGAYVAASKLPKGTPEEKSARRSAMQAALVTSAYVPLELAATAGQVMRLLEPVVEQGTAHALSDAEIAVSLTEAAALAALANVRINVPLIQDADLAATLDSRAHDLDAEIRDVTTRLRQILTLRRSS